MALVHDLSSWSQGAAIRRLAYKNTEHRQCGVCAQRNRKNLCCKAVRRKERKIFVKDGLHPSQTTQQSDRAAHLSQRHPDARRRPSAPRGPICSGMSADAPEEQSPYGSGSRAQDAPAAAGAAPSPRKVRIPHLHAMKAEGRRWAMLTAYDMYAAQIFDEAGIPVLLVGDSAGNNVYGYETTVPGHARRDDPARPGRVVGRAPGARRCRPAVRLLRRVGRAGLRQRRAAHEGGARPRGQARGRHGDGPARQGPHRRRHPRHGARRLHPAERAPARRLPRAGSRRRRRRARRRGPRPAGRRRLRRRPRDGPGAGRRRASPRC